MMNALPAGPRFCSASLPSGARPITVMITPSLANQLAPRTSSMEETDFKRCWSVDFAAGTRSGEAGGDDETRAAAAGGIGWAAGATGFCSTGTTGGADTVGGVAATGGMIGGLTGGATGGIASARGVAAGVSLIGATIVGAGACEGGIEPGTETGWRTSGLGGFSATGVVGAGTAASLLCSSPTARCNFVC